MKKCIECDKEALYSRRTPFSGTHYYCEHHAKLKDDFLKDEESYSYWGVLTGLEFYTSDQDTDESMNKEQVIQKLDALEKEAQALRKIIEEPESLLEVNGNSADVYIPALRVCSDKTISEEYYKAFKTLLLLRQQPGTEPADDGADQYYIRLNRPGEVIIDFLYGKNSKTQLISPCFKTWLHAEAAIDFVGKEAITHMFKTFHGIYD